MEPERSSKKTKKNRWSAACIDLLVELWADKIADLRGNRKNNHVYQEIRHELDKRGFTVGTDEIKVRIHNLTSKYKKEKALIGPSGGSPSTWPFYAKIHSFLGTFPITNVSQRVEESFSELLPDAEIIAEYVEEAVDSDLSYAGPSLDSEMPLRPGKKEKKNIFQNELLKRWDKMEEASREQNEYLRETDQKLFELESQRTALLERFVQNSAEMKDAFISFLGSRN
ncbi:uncharacterized protein LOC131686126 [Topomyia yanbarensis]|uniref:uncharacterized protein LOC131686126 n=1 Tax=Topomyia yanbarensis TaxID=2498891 RepID=UPI00273AC148|nr:uncharacterized protein LOC131686126 [Topomyia yanbarensis]XP_058826273.1 uncharacterized protein LOC131686126 [Topomyia yanbarensis]